MNDAITCLTAALVVITAIYVYLTYRMAKSSEASVHLMKEQVDAASRPYLSIALVKRPNDPFIFLLVENTGKTAARDMTLTLGPEFDSVQHLKGLKELKDSYLFTKTLATFNPNSPVFFLFGFGAALLSDDKDGPKQPLSITAKYSFSDKTVTETTWLDVNLYNASALDKDPIVSALNKIKEEIAKAK